MARVVIYATATDQDLAGIHDAQLETAIRERVQSLTSVGGVPVRLRVLGIDVEPEEPARG